MPHLQAGSTATKRAGRLIACAAAVFVLQAATAAADADAPTVMPIAYKQIKAQLTAGCGAARATTIANLVWDEDIHIVYRDQSATDPNVALVDGSPSWHRYWISVYRSAITQLMHDCKPGTPAPQTYN